MSNLRSMTKGAQLHMIRNIFEKAMQYNDHDLLEHQRCMLKDMNLPMITADEYIYMYETVCNITALLKKGAR